MSRRSRAFWLAAALSLAGFVTVGRVGAADDSPAPGASRTNLPAAAEQKNAASEGASITAAEQEKLEKAFAESMSGATLCGHFTAGSMTDAPCKDTAADGKPYGDKGPADNGANKATPDEPGAAPTNSNEPTAKPKKAAGQLKEDRYTLGRVQKLQGDNWLIEARIQYGGHDVTVPLMLKIKWAGDTPVITLTDFSVPGLGVFTSRVLFYRGQYAGTWKHGDHGGELFGKVLPAAKQ